MNSDVTCSSILHIPDGPDASSIMDVSFGEELQNCVHFQEHINHEDYLNIEKFQEIGKQEPPQQVPVSTEYVFVPQPPPKRPPLLKAHSKKCVLRSNSKLFKCDKCEGYFKTEKLLVNHDIEAHCFPCPICGNEYQFPTKKDFIWHFVSLHSGATALSNCETGTILVPVGNATVAPTGAANKSQLTSWPCSVCGQEFQGTNELESHLRKEHPGLQSKALLPRVEEKAKPNVKCPFCNQLFTEIDVVQHLKTVHNQVVVRVLSADQATEAPKTENSEVKKKRSYGADIPCPDCAIVCNGIVKLNKHIRIAHRKRVKKVDNAVAVKKRLKSVCDKLKRRAAKPTVVLKCTQCGLEILGLVKLKRHMLDSHGFRTPREQRVAAILNSDARHPLTQEEKTEIERKRRVLRTIPQKCPKCSEICRHVMDLVIHMKTFHDIKLIIPKNAAINNSSLAQALLKKLRVEDPWLERGCEDCNKLFSSRFALVSHRKLMHDVVLKTEMGAQPSVSLPPRLSIGSERRLTSVCDVCGENVAKFRLKEHKLKHTSVKNHACHVCGKLFRYKCSIYYHMKSAHSEDREVCQECGKQLASVSGLRAHMDAVHSAETVRCNFDGCLKEFQSERRLRVHVNRMHAQNKPDLKCSYCQKTFRDKTAQQSHENLHTRKKSWSCPFCGKVFFQLGQMNQHRRLRHKHEHKVLTMTTPADTAITHDQHQG